MVTERCQRATKNITDQWRGAKRRHRVGKRQGEPLKGVDESLKAPRVVKE